MVSARLFRSHTVLSIAGLLLQLLVAVPVFSITFQPSAADTLLVPLVLLPGFLLGATLDLLLLHGWYRPLRALDRLSSDQMYAQNEVLNRGVVALHNLPLVSFLRVYCCRAVVVAASAHAAAGLAPWSPHPASASFAPALWLLNLTLVPFPAAVVELFVLPPIIGREYHAILSYREIILPGWRRRIRTAGSGVRLITAVAALAIGPMAALAIKGGDLTPADAMILAVCSLSGALFAGMLALRDTRRSVGAMLDGMRQVEKNRPGMPVHITTPDEFSELADGFARMLAGLKEQSFIRDTFGKYVPRAIVEAVLRDGLKLQGERRSVAILRTEIRGFRSWLAERSAPDLINDLNAYLATVTAAAQHYGGTIDKVSGDRVLVVFGAPVTLTDPVDRALLASLDVRREVERLNRAPGRQPGRSLHAVMTVHYGEVIAGHVGAAERWEYSIIGPAVDEADAIAAAAGNTTEDILVSPAARALAGDIFTFGEQLLPGSNASAWSVHPLNDASAASERRRA